MPAFLADVYQNAVIKTAFKLVTPFLKFACTNAQMNRQKF